MKSKEFDELMRPVKTQALELVSPDVFTREAGFALQAINQNPQLQKAPQESLMQAVFNIALTGLSLNPALKYAYLIPRWSGGGMKAVLEPSYIGLTKLLTDSGSVRQIYVYPVYEGDEFEQGLGTEITIHHKPMYKTKDLQLVYAVAILADGQKQVEVMTKDEIDGIRDMSESYKAYAAKKIKSCVWVDHYTEMARKTVVKRIAKYLPKTDRYERFAQAVELDNADYKISDDYKNYLTVMVESSVYDPETQAMLIDKIHGGVTSDEADKIKLDLINNQKDRIAAGENYNQTDIKKKLKTEIG